MSDKVTLRFEQFDGTGNDIINTGPISLQRVVDTVADLANVPVPEIEFNEDNPLDLTQKYSIVAFVKNVNDLESQIGTMRYRGAYYFYNYETDSWQELLIGSHTHENKDFLDKLTDFDYTTEEIGSKRYLTIEVVQTDEQEITYAYDLKWEDLPEPIPLASEEELENGPLFLSKDSEGNTQWVNNFLSSQSFQIKTVDNITETDTIVLSDIYFNEEKDEVLVIDGHLFVNSRTISYDSETNEMTITAVLPEIFDADSTITIIIIRNTADAVIEQLAADYITKEQAISYLSGNSVNLRHYATKLDLYSKANRYHTHSQFARQDHDHDWRYANFHHEHGQYTTQSKVKELIEERLTLNPEILDILLEISTFFTENAQNQTFQDFLLTLATSQDITEINARIDSIISNYYNITQLNSYLSSRTFESDQINTTYLDEGGQQKNLNEVLQDMQIGIDADLENIKSDGVSLSTNLEVKLGSEHVGSYDTGEFILTDESLTDILRKLIQRVIPPIYIAPTLITTFGLPNMYNELGSLVSLNINSIFTVNDASFTGLNYYQIKKDNDILFLSSSVQNHTESITITENPITIQTIVTFSEGNTKLDNFENLNTTGKILAGNLITNYILQGYRAIFFGGTSLSSTQYTLNSDFIRTFEKEILPSYNDLDITATVQPGTKTILFALPVGTELTNIYYLEQNVDILSNFTVHNVLIEGASNLVTSAYYNVYIFELTKPTPYRMTIKFIS